MVVALLPVLRASQRRLMTETVDVYRAGILVHANVPARITSSRLFTEPADPHDANLRSTSEWGFTLPWSVEVLVADTIVFHAGANSAIVGEVLQDDTWKTATRVWATRPKTATPPVSITFYRYSSGSDDWVSVGAHTVQVVFDRVAALETPLRYSPAGRSSYQGGTLIGDLTFAPVVDDRFALNSYACIIDAVLPNQPQHVEAHFLMDMSGAR
jgi:hypothetical protein